uniref:Endoplasmic reticulum membrane sensor NFE2L1 n=1 Tax=Periophthalmus magnuspinnatus TaxID=409849 RepID=A0A3B3ZMU9_9GOBI
MSLLDLALEEGFGEELSEKLEEHGYLDPELTRRPSQLKQLNLVRDIRRRGKNKIAAQNCRKRKMDNLQGLEKDVTMLRRRKSRLLKDKQEALRTLQELKQRLSSLYQDVFSSLRDGEGRPLDVHEYMLSFESDGTVDVVSRRQGRKEKSRRKQKDK